jgi:hypothetical protein
MFDSQERGKRSFEFFARHILGLSLRVELCEDVQRVFDSVSENEDGCVAEILFPTKFPFVLANALVLWLRVNEFEVLCDVTDFRPSETFFALYSESLMQHRVHQALCACQKHAAVEVEIAGVAVALRQVS